MSGGQGRILASAAELLRESELRFRERLVSSQKTMEALTRAVPEPPAAPT